ncbi:MAG TPA: MBL fold metallo-hydrolase [Acidobacteriota bacterium]
MLSAVGLGLVLLGSGSGGNCALLKSNGRRFLVDVGLSAREITKRLQAIGEDPEKIDAIFLTHEHEDHARGLKRWTKLYPRPVLGTPATLEAVAEDLGDGAQPVELKAGDALDVSGLWLQAFSVCHDAADPVGFVFSDGSSRIGFATDLGFVTALVVERLRDCEAVVIEANHDIDLLREGPYPWFLKQRLMSRTGHLSNDACAGLIREAAGRTTRHLVLAHLSQFNNEPALAFLAGESALKAVGLPTVEVQVAAADRPSDPITL